jgi:hypothetical protein
MSKLHITYTLFHTYTHISKCMVESQTFQHFFHWWTLPGSLCSTTHCSLMIVIYLNLFKIYYIIFVSNLSASGLENYFPSFLRDQ